MSEPIRGRCICEHDRTHHEAGAKECRTGACRCPFFRQEDEISVGLREGALRVAPPEQEIARLESELREARAERDDARAAIDGITEAADKITVANMDVAIQLRAAESALSAERTARVEAEAEVVRLTRATCPHLECGKAPTHYGVSCMSNAIDALENKLRAALAAEPGEGGPAARDARGATCTWQAPYCCGKPAVSRLVWIGPPEVQHSEAPAFCAVHDALHQKTNNDWWRREELPRPLPPEGHPRAAEGAATPGFDALRDKVKDAVAGDVDLEALVNPENFKHWKKP